MSFENRSIDDLVKIAAAGGGFSLAATHKDTDDLIRIAAAGSEKGSRITFTGLTHRDINDLISISAAGQGCVVLEV